MALGVGQKVEIILNPAGPFEENVLQVATWEPSENIQGYYLHSLLIFIRGETKSLSIKSGWKCDPFEPHPQWVEPHTIDGGFASPRRNV